MNINAYALCSVYMMHKCMQSLHADVYCKRHAWLHTNLTDAFVSPHGTNICVYCSKTCFFLPLVKISWGGVEELICGDSACKIVIFCPLTKNKKSVRAKSNKRLQKLDIRWLLFGSSDQGVSQRNPKHRAGSRPVALPAWLHLIF